MSGIIPSEEENSVHETWHQVPQFLKAPGNGRSRTLPRPERTLPHSRAIIHLFHHPSLQPPGKILLTSALIEAL